MKTQIQKLKTDLQRLEQENSQLRQALKTDELTGLGNFRSFVQDIENSLNEVKKHSLDRAQKYALIFIDVDSFKMVNETHGHWAASRLLGLVGRRLSKTIRETDLAFRYGGDEFVILVKGRHQDIQKMVLRIKNSVASKSFSVEGFRGKQEIPLTVTTGVRVLTPDDTISTVIEEADRALFEAKRRQKKDISQMAA